MLSIIICSRNNDIPSRLRSNIEDTIGNTPYELVVIDNSMGEYSIFSAYNEGVARAHGEYLCFAHEDIIFHSTDWGEKVIEHLNDKRIGFIGLVGAYYETQLSITWDRWSANQTGCCVSYIQSGSKRDQRETVVVKPVKGSEGFVSVLDGFWMCCRAELFQKGMKWDEDYYNGFHQYDSDICMQAVKLGYWNKVIYDVIIEHCSCGNFNDSFYEAVIKFHKKWDYYLPVVAPGFTMPDEPESYRAIREIGRLNQQLANIATSKLITVRLDKIKWALKFKVLSSICPILARFHNTNNPRVALCCIAKMENDYIREFVCHYHDLGVDNITIFDNNDIDGERLEDVIGDFISSGFCRIIDYRGREKAQLDAYNEFYRRFGKDYDWIAVFDCDEFLTLKKHKSIKEFLCQKKFSQYQQVHINWLQYGDNGMLDNDGRPLLERFTDPVTPYQELPTIPYYSNCHTKTIIRGGLKRAVFNSPHTCSAVYYKCCDVTGNSIDTEAWWAPYNYDEAYLKHFSTKTIGEWIRNKQRRGLATFTYEEAAQYLTLDMFWEQNEKTDEKEAYAQQLIDALTKNNTINHTTNE